ncbi:MAG: protein-L-isoaspartate O-methyltransferase [Alphaproteobacteria bacterium]|nr:MAG: protein-L-isoaspartate O-methyltransferase [Alphaproteobacteria bacterium]TAF15172.1 MAG: protein-L-isoaspartate O-methyltransferase [Alphaproteobacteria bacterium]TAF41511.1 MAG: protein-L-isoaspartate O-methyltransferase [Alphaproteobacteria bacterium]TAF77035.1 MAG: protein-L-isoaspartate O-methyltransferase [Alphaproteobacteria bacterium]
MVFGMIQKKDIQEYDANIVSLAQVNMFKGQLATNKISDERVIHALMSVDRSHYIPEHLQHNAYVDADVKLCNHRYLLAPLTFARMLVLANVAPHHNVLDVGAGKGYSAAVLAQMAKHVVAIEENPELVAAARKKLAQHHVCNVDIVTTPLAIGCSAHQPYDVIVAEGVLRSIPTKYEKQLAEDGTIVALKAAAPMFATKQVLAHIVVGKKRQDQVHYAEYETKFAYPLYETLAQDGFVF